MINSRFYSLARCNPNPHTNSGTWNQYIGLVTSIPSMSINKTQIKALSANCYKWELQGKHHPFTFFCLLACVCVRARVWWGRDKDAAALWKLPLGSLCWEDVNDLLKILQVGDAIDHHLLIREQLNLHRRQHVLYEESPVKPL